ncbi:MAG: GNAT family N-acetyltransferase [Candidatus Hodarchaeales archaeon]
MKQQAEVIFLQELLANSWPAREYYFLNGWIVRFAEGVTSRANSVLPNHYSGSSVLEDISLVEKLYKQRQLPVRFQVADQADPPDLEEILLSLDYRKISETRVMVGKLENWIQFQVNEVYNYIDVTNKPEQWLRTLTELSNSDEMRISEKRGIIGRIPSSRKALLIAMEEKQIPVGLILGVLDRGHLCISDLFVNSRYRRQGIARSLMISLNSWAIKQQATKAYLQVETNNEVAIALYEQLGMEPRFQYRYLVK